ncbi:MAG: sulfotransferase family 2 domain-containing protein [Halioglobus sp.]|nr:sulfotransferase family 2 domain-containing protein [Halioglobus sp.]
MADPQAPAEEQQRYFFIHIQKTAGSSLRQHLLANFTREQIYPSPPGKGENWSESYLSGALLTSLPRWALEPYLLFHGHMPFTATRRLPFDRPPKRFTILREPVERTLSVIGQKKRHRPEFKGATLEEVYSHESVFAGQILNHQAKIFAVPDDSDALAGYAPYPVGPVEFERAKENLASLEVIGLMSDMQGFLDNLATTFGWTMLDEDVRENVGRKAEVSQSLLDRIAEDNRLEMEFYAYAEKLVKERQAQVAASA